MGSHFIWVCLILLYIGCENNQTNWIMRRNLIRAFLMLALFILATCQDPGDADILMTVDRDFSDLSQEAGMHKAFLTYAADSAVLLPDG